MKLLVEYVDFHSDNQQGGSGTSFELQTILEIDEPCSDVWSSIYMKMSELVLEQRPFIVRGERTIPVIKRVTVL